jgi:serine/threonine protein kinase
MSAELWVHTNIIKLLASHLIQLIFKQEELDLEDFWHQHPFSKLEAILLALGVAKAVVAIHSKNFIHRDIKVVIIPAAPTTHLPQTWPGSYLQSKVCFAVCLLQPCTVFTLSVCMAAGNTCGCHLLSQF